MGTSSGFVLEVRDFLRGLLRDLPDVFRKPVVRISARPVSRPGSGDPARALFDSRVRHWSSAMGVSPRRVFLKNQKTLWGSCSSRGNLNFNRALADAPPEVVDYVVIHELAHLKEMNHSRRFWAVVESWCPDQKQSRLWLRQNASRLNPRSLDGATRATPWCRPS